MALISADASMEGEMNFTWRVFASGPEKSSVRFVWLMYYLCSDGQVSAFWLSFVLYLGIGIEDKYFKHHKLNCFKVEEF